MHIVRSLAVSLVLLALSALPARAQQPPVTAGLEVGVNASHISPALSNQSISSAPGLFVGGYVLIPAFPVVGIQIEGVYSQKKTHLSSTQDLELDYFELPVLAKLSLFKGLYMLEGVAFDFPVSAQQQPASGASTDIKSQVTNPDVGLVIGVAYPIGRVHVEGRYEGGFRNIYSSTSASAQRGRSWTFLARFAL